METEFVEVSATDSTAAAAVPPPEVEKKKEKEVVPQPRSKCGAFPPPPAFLPKKEEVRLDSVVTPILVNEADARVVEQLRCRIQETTDPMGLYHHVLFLLKHLSIDLWLLEVERDIVPRIQNKMYAMSPADQVLYLCFYQSTHPSDIMLPCCPPEISKEDLAARLMDWIHKTDGYETALVHHQGNAQKPYIKLTWKTPQA